MVFLDSKDCVTPMIHPVERTIDENFMKRIKSWLFVGLMRKTFTTKCGENIMMRSSITRNFLANCRRTGSCLRTSKWNFMERKYGNEYYLFSQGQAVKQYRLYYHYYIELNLLFLVFLY